MNLPFANRCILHSPWVRPCPPHALPLFSLPDPACLRFSPFFSPTSVPLLSCIPSSDTADGSAGQPSAPRPGAARKAASRRPKPGLPHVPPADLPPTQGRKRRAHETRTFPDRPSRLRGTRPLSAHDLPPEDPDEGARGESFPPMPFPPFLPSLPFLSSCLSRLSCLPCLSSLPSFPAFPAFPAFPLFPPFPPFLFRAARLAKRPESG